MKFEWDENKNKINIRKHGIDFTDVPEIFNNPMLIMFDETKDDLEERWVGIGFLRHIVAVIIFTERNEYNQEIIRIISARKATKYERKRYEKEIKY
jgi:uncharacterized DUF497 family protein